MTIIYDNNAKMYIDDVLVNKNRVITHFSYTSSPANALRFEKKDADLVKQIVGMLDVDLIELEDEKCPRTA